MNTEASWEAIRRALATGVPTDLRRAGDPPVDFLVEAGGAALVLRIPLSNTSVSLPRPRQSMAIRIAKIGTDSVLEVRCAEREQFHEFHALIDVIADRVQEDGVSPAEAVSETIENWERLIRPEGALSEEEQVGLWGELWVVARLADQMAASLALSAWVGPLKEPHDFRLHEHEFEVKTTRRVQRQHTIHGLDQLTPSDGCSLSLISVQIEPTDEDSGLTLESAVGTLRTVVSADAALGAQVEHVLDELRYRDDHAQLYRQPYRLRSEVMTTAVGDGFPRLVRADVVKLLGPTAKLVENVRYEIDLSGWPGLKEFDPTGLASTS